MAAHLQLPCSSSPIRAHSKLPRRYFPVSPFPHSPRLRSRPRAPASSRLVRLHRHHARAERSLREFQQPGRQSFQFESRHGRRRVRHREKAHRDLAQQVRFAIPAVFFNSRIGTSTVVSNKPIVSQTTEGYKSIYRSTSETILPFIPVICVYFGDGLSPKAFGG